MPNTSVQVTVFRPGLHTSCVMMAWNGPPPVVLAAGAQREVVSELSNQQFKWHADRHSHGPYIISSKRGRSCHSPGERKRTLDFPKEIGARVKQFVAGSVLGAWPLSLLVLVARERTVEERHINK